MVENMRLLALLMCLGCACAADRYVGRSIGALSQLNHGVKGHVYAVDARTIYLQGFTYDGEGPAAYFYVGTSGAPSAAGTRLRDERGAAGPLRKYRGEGIALALPDSLTLRDVKWFAVWCDEYSVNFGDVRIPRELEVPKPAKVGALRGVHGVSSDAVVVVDAQTLLVPNFSYDGEAPDAKFWVGRGSKPSPAGVRIPDENGKEAPLRKYDRKTIVLTLPGELTVFDIGHFGVWCEAFTVDFGHVTLPKEQLANVPPSLKMLGVSPQSKLNCEVLYDDMAFEVRWAVAGDSIVLQLVAKLDDGEYMSFGISGDPSHSQMVGGDVAVAWVDKSTLKGYAVDYYLDAKSQCAGVRGSCPDERLVESTNSNRLLNAALVNGYSIVTYQRSLRAADELDLPVLTNASQPVIWAVGPLNSRDEVSYHHHFTKGDKFIEFGRPPVWNCPMPEGEDEHETPAPVSAAEKEELARRQAEQDRRKEELVLREEEEDRRMEELARRQEELVRRREELVRRDEEQDRRDVEQAGRQDEIERRQEEQARRQEELVRRQEEQARRKPSPIKSNPVPTPRPAPKAHPWEIPPIQCYEPADGVFYAQMGPTGGKQGYPAITGHVGWGISWYINGLLIPEVNVVRGRKYTFVVEGGDDPDQPARYHPFYITDDPVGGYFHKTEAEKKNIKIFAGARRSRSGELVPTGVGRLCNWTPDKNGPDADEYPSFGAYQRSLTLVCEQGDPGVVTWTPDQNTPDTVYYQCYTHRYLGWKINVVDECDAAGEESRVVETVLPADLQGEESVQVHTRVKPDNNLERKRVEKIINSKPHYNDFSSDKDGLGAAPQLFTPEYELPISSGQIKDVIDVVETLESSMKQTRPNNSHAQYQVHEDVREFLPEQPVREGDEYVVAQSQAPDAFMLPPNLKPLTLQSVLRPNSPNKPMRPPFRRPIPPEIKLRRPPPPMHHKANGPGYPLPMPSHNNHGQKKQNPKYSNNRGPPNMSRPPMGAPIKPPMHHLKPGFIQGPPKQVPKIPTGPVQSIVVGKPAPGNIAPPQSQTLNLGKSDIIANHVVKSQITLPGLNDVIVAQHSAPQISVSRPGQIILGKPMENPVPLDQQMTPSIHFITRAPPTPAPEYIPSSTQRVVVQPDPSQNNIKSSDFIGESAEPAPLQPAVNTGFKPDSIVVESGFKPIIREPLMAGEDRITNFDNDINNNNRRQDTDVEEDYEEAPQPISNHVYNSPSDKMTETFEPMFIPSPPDHHIPTNDRTKEIFPSNHAKEDRPHPVYVKTESELNALFSKKNMEKEVPDMVMESDRVSPHYLPPDPKFPKEHSQKLSHEGTYATYDGKTVSASSLVAVPPAPSSKHKPFSSKVPSNSELLLKTPQFGPFNGEIPVEVAQQIKNTSPKPKTPHRPTHTSTRLKLVNAVTDTKEETVEELKAEESRIHESKQKPNYSVSDVEQNFDQGDSDEESLLRRKRETKTTQFERGEAVEQPQTVGISSTKNQVDFDVGKKMAANGGARLWSTNLVLVTLWLRFL